MTRRRKARKKSTAQKEAATNKTTTAKDGSEKNKTASIVVAAAISSVVTLFLSALLGQPVNSLRDAARDAVADWFRSEPPPPSLTERAVADYRRQTLGAQIWAATPVPITEGFTFFKKHLNYFDPNTPNPVHEFITETLPYPVTIDELIRRIELFRGKPVVSVGELVEWNLYKDYPSGNGEFILQLIGGTEDSARITAYCRVPAPVDTTFHKGDIFVFAGTPIATGQGNAKEGGAIDIVYLGCSSVTKFSERHELMRDIRNLAPNRLTDMEYLLFRMYEERERSLEVVRRSKSSLTLRVRSPGGPKRCVAQTPVELQHSRIRPLQIGFTDHKGEVVIPLRPLRGLPDPVAAVPLASARVSPYAIELCLPARLPIRSDPAN